MPEEAKGQLKEIDPKTICMDEENKSMDYTYRIAMVFTILRIKFALSGKGNKLEWDTCANIIEKAENYFKDIRNSMDEDHITHYEYLHNIPQMKLIKNYYKPHWQENGKKIVREEKETYYNVGALVTAAVYK